MRLCVRAVIVCLTQISQQTNQHHRKKIPNKSKQNRAHTNISLPTQYADFVSCRKTVLNGEITQTNSEGASMIKK